jgi:hypothetical protein
MTVRHIIRDLSHKNATREWTGSEARRFVDAWFQSARSFTLGVTRLHTDFAMADLAAVHGRSRNAMIRKMQYILTFYVEEGQRTPSTLQLKDEPTMLDPSRHPNDREKFAFLLMRGHRKVVRTGGEFVKELGPEVMNWVLHLSKDRLQDLHREFPVKRDVGGLF